MHSGVVSLGIVELQRDASSSKRTLARTEVQDGREGNAPASITGVLAKFAQGEGDTCRQLDKSMSRNNG